MRLPALVAALAAPLALVGCGGPQQSQGPQQTLRKYIAAIHADRPQAAYALLDESVRKTMTSSEFAKQWPSLKPELTAQAAQIEARLTQPLEISAKVSYPEGSRARLRYADGQWRIDGGISVAFQTRTPVDALKAFVRAVEQRSYEAVAKMLARSVRDQIERDIGGRVSKLKKWLETDGEIEVTGDRARARFDARYKIELINEDGQWRILDVD